MPNTSTAQSFVLLSFVVFQIIVDKPCFERTWIGTLGTPGQRRQLTLLLHETVQSDWTGMESDGGSNQGMSRVRLRSNLFSAARRHRVHRDTKQ